MRLKAFTEMYTDFRKITWFQIFQDIQIWFCLFLHPMNILILSFNSSFLCHLAKLDIGHGRLWSKSEEKECGRIRAYLELQWSLQIIAPFLSTICQYNLDNKYFCWLELLIMWELRQCNCTLFVLNLSKFNTCARISMLKVNRVQTAEPPLFGCLPRSCLPTVGANATRKAPS